MALLLLATAAPPARAACEGTCDDGAGGLMVVSAGECNAGEACHAGCDASGSRGPRPYAECVSLATGEAAPRPVIVPTDVRRE
jgi:hypothetical protein